jgi:2-oxoisovalerate dehydrogenase E2 component (dihydrolipoyl transacylase)
MTDERVKEFLVPDLGEGLEEVTVSSWNVGVGDQIDLNETLCTVETAKAAVEIPSPYAGRIVELGGAVGEVLAVGAVLARIDIVAGSAGPPEVAQSAKTNGAVRTPVLVGYGADVSFDSSRRQRPRAKPGVRRLAAELLVDLSTLEPGPDGLISRAAVLAAAGVSGEARSGIAHDVLPVRGVHAEMAKRMALARNQIPDAHAAVQVDCTALLALRDRMRRSADDLAEQITPFVLTLRLLVIALTHHRIFNSTWVDGPGGPQVHTQHAIHLGFGVAAPRGLLVPVISDAQGRTTRELADVAARLTRAARDGTLTPAELAGSTFTVSNFGALGLDEGVPVINFPEAAILGMGSLKPRAVVVDGTLAVRPTMTLTCAFDHRIADGAQVALFLGELRALIEAPELALLDL